MGEYRVDVDVVVDGVAGTPDSESVTCVTEGLCCGCPVARWTADVSGVGPAAVVAAVDVCALCGTGEASAAADREACVAGLDAARSWLAAAAWAAGKFPFLISS